MGSVTKVQVVASVGLLSANASRRAADSVASSATRCGCWAQHVGMVRAGFHP